MPTTIDQIVQAGLEMADVEKSNNFSTQEKLDRANGALSDVYDFIVACWQDYFAVSALFTLPTTNVITLSEITSGVAPVPAYPVAVPALGGRVIRIPTTAFSATVADSAVPQFFAVSGGASFATSRGYIPPAGRVLQLGITVAAAGANTVFTLYKNGVATGATVSVAAAATGTFNEVEGNFGAAVHFNGISDVMDLVAVADGAGTAYDFEGSTLFLQDQPATDFYKELGLTRTQDGMPETIDPLAGYGSRNDLRGDGKRRYWILAQTLSVWPQFDGIDHAGTYVLDYIPNCPVLEAGDILPPELERWKDLISIRTAIRFMSKRRQDTSDLKEQRAEKEAAILQAAGSRKAEVRKLRPIYRHDQNIGFGTIGPFPRR